MHGSADGQGHRGLRRTGWCGRGGQQSCLGLAYLRSRHRDAVAQLQVCRVFRRVASDASTTSAKIPAKIALPTGIATAVTTKNQNGAFPMHVLPLSSQIVGTSFDAEDVRPRELAELVRLFRETGRELAAMADDGRGGEQWCGAGF
jgi:hypothetical protein